MFMFCECFYVRILIPVLTAYCLFMNKWPAGLPTYLVPLLLRLSLALADHCARLQIILTYLLTYMEMLYVIVLCIN